MVNLFKLQFVLFLYLIHCIVPYRYTVRWSDGAIDLLEIGMQEQDNQDITIKMMNIKQQKEYNEDETVDNKKED
jgi:hypothetical protein